MDNINSHNTSENITKKKICEILPYPILLVTLLSINNPSKANITRNSNNYNQSITEIILDSTIISNIEKKTGISLPQEYSNIINDFVTNNEVIKNNTATNFTEEFIVDQMKSDWGISKKNQLLFIRDVIYEQVTNENFYDGNDGDDNRLTEFEKVIDNLENCGIKYRDNFITYMEGISAEARQQSAEATLSGLNEMIKFYHLYKENPNLIRDDEIIQAQEHSNRIIKNCKTYGIDYRAIFLKDLGSTEKVDEMLNFYNKAN